MPTSKPLHIAVDPDWIDHPKIVELREKGHTISVCPADVDLFLSRRAHAWTDSFWSLKISLEQILKWARSRKLTDELLVSGTIASSPSRKTSVRKRKSTPTDDTSS